MSSVADSYPSASEAACASLLVLMAGLLVGANLGWFFGRHLFGISALVLGLALALILCLTSTYGHSTTVSGGRSMNALLLLGSALAVSLLPALTVHDYSYDGQEYHLQAVRILVEGWNPLGSEQFRGMHELWVNGYAKGPWTWAAVLSQVLGSDEAGKSLNILAACAGGLSVYSLLYDELSFGRRAAVGAAILSAANPVLAYQWATNLNDSIIGSLILVALSRQMALLLRQERGTAIKSALLHLSLGSAISLLVSTKLSGSAYGLMLGFIGVVSLALLGHWRAARAVAGSVTSGLLIGVFVLGWNPYVTNSVQHGHPFYPLYGTGKVDIITSNRPVGVEEVSRVGQLWRSVFSESHSELERDRASAFRPKWPGTFTLKELKLFVAKTDMRIGGFGPLYSLAVVLGCVAFVLTVAERLRGRKLCLAFFIPVTVVFMSSIFPEPWWARYVPQMALLPLALAGAASCVKGRWVRGLGIATWSVAAVNSTLVIALFLSGLTVRELDSREQIGSLARISVAYGPIAVDWGRSPALAKRFDDYGVRWRPPISDEPCARWISLHQSSVRVCLPQDSDSNYRDESAWAKGVKVRVLGN